MFWIGFIVGVIVGELVMLAQIAFFKKDKGGD